VNTGVQAPVAAKVRASRSDASDASPSSCSTSSDAGQSGANPSKKSPCPFALRSEKDTGASILSQNSTWYWPTGLP
jgi:hypothetical protein